MNESGPETLIEAVRYFSDKKVCHDYMVQIKWPDGKIACPSCGGDNIGFLATREIYKCRGCRVQFSSRTGTIWEGSLINLGVWFAFIWCVANGTAFTLNEFAAACGVTYRTVWLMNLRVKLAMRTGAFSKICT